MALGELAAVDEHLASFEQALGDSARANVRQRGEEAVEPLACSLVRDAVLHARAAAWTALRSETHECEQEGCDADDDERVGEVEGRPVA